MLRWAPLVAMVAGLGLAAAFLNHQSHALADARRDAEAGRLILANQIVSAQGTARSLRQDIDGLLAANALLKQAVEEAKTAAPGSRIVEIDTLKTEPVIVNPVPRVVPAPPQEPEKVEPLPDPPKLNSPPDPVCVLANGDLGSLIVNVVELQTKQGNTLVTGTAEAWRDTPSRAKLFEGRFQSKLSTSEVLAVPPEPRWGAGVVLVCGWGRACAVGPSLAFPALSAWGFKGEVSAGLALGELTQGVITGIVRW